MFIGNHLSCAKGYEIMGKEALALGDNTFAFFTRNPRGSAVKELDPTDAQKLCNLMDEHHFGEIGCTCTLHNECMCGKRPYPQIFVECAGGRFGAYGIYSE